MFLLNYFYGNKQSEEKVDEKKIREEVKDESEDWVWIDEEKTAPTPTPKLNFEPGPSIQLEYENSLLEHPAFSKIRRSQALENTFKNVPTKEPEIAPQEQQEPPTPEPSIKQIKLKIKNTKKYLGVKDEIKNYTENDVQIFNTNNQLLVRKSGNQNYKTNKRSGYYKNPKRNSNVNNDRKCGRGC